MMFKHFLFSLLLMLPASVVAQNVDANSLLFHPYTVGALPTASANKNRIFLVSDGTSISDCTTGSGSFAVLCYSTGSGYVSVSGLNFPGQSNTIAPNEVQVFTATSTYADLVIGTIGADPCCTMQPGSTWVNTSGLNGNPHINFFDGSFYWVNLTNGDNPCNMANGCSGSGSTALVNSPVFKTPNIGDAIGTSLTLAQTTGDQFDLQAGGELAAFCHCCDVLSARLWHDKGKDVKLNSKRWE